jgi:hypothetical protein
MPVYSKIQQIRDAKRRERQQKWKQKTRRIKNQENCQSLCAVRKRKQRENTTKFIKAEAERKTNARERKRRSRAMNKERNELQKLEKNMRGRKTEKQRRNNY